MRIINNRIILNFIFLNLAFASCQNKLSYQQTENKKSVYYDTGELECQYEIGKDGKVNGYLLCYFKNGSLKSSSFWINDTTPINEELKYYPSGILKEYNFYDMIGQKRYSRTYDHQGELLDENGDFLTYIILNSEELIVGDTVEVKVHVATPPGCSYSIFGINGEGRYEVFKPGNKPYLSILSKEAKFEGEFTFPFEVEFMDSIKDTTIIKKDHVNFRIKSNSSISSEN